MDNFEPKNLSPGSEDVYHIRVSWLMESKAIDFKDLKGSKEAVLEAIKKKAGLSEKEKLFILSSCGFFETDFGEQSLLNGKIMEVNGQKTCFMVIYTERMSDWIAKPEVKVETAKSWRASSIEWPQLLFALTQARNLANTAYTCFTDSFLPSEHLHFADELCQFTNKLQTIHMLYLSHLGSTKEEFDTKVEQIVQRAAEKVLFIPSEKGTEIQEPFINFLCGSQRDILTRLHFLHDYLDLRRNLIDLGWHFDSVDYEDRLRSIEDGISMIDRYSADLKKLLPTSSDGLDTKVLDEKYTRRYQTFLAEWSASTVRSMSHCPRRAIFLSKNALVWPKLTTQHKEWVKNAYDAASLLDMCLNAENTCNAWDKTISNMPAAFRSLMAPTARLRHAIPPTVLNQLHAIGAASFFKDFTAEMFSHLSLPPSSPISPLSSLFVTREVYMPSNYASTGSAPRESPPPTHHFYQALPLLPSDKSPSQSTVSTSISFGSNSHTSEFMDTGYSSNPQESSLTTLKAAIRALYGNGPITSNHLLEMARLADSAEKESKSLLEHKEAELEFVRNALLMERTNSLTLMDENKRLKDTLNRLQIGQ